MREQVGRCERSGALTEALDGCSEDPADDGASRRRDRDRGRVRPLQPVRIDAARGRRRLVGAAPQRTTLEGRAHERALSLSRVPLVGRERESGVLRDALDAALSGSGRVVLLGGEPGIGKTSLAAALADEAEARRVPVWWGRAFEDGSAPAYWPWSTALRRHVAQAGHAAVAAAAGPFASELARVFPALRADRADDAPSVPASECGESDSARFRLFELVSRFLAAVASPAGLVVVLDDLHWADQPSLRLLEYVAADLADARVLVVATYRDTELRRDHPATTTLSRLAREPVTRRLEVGGLSPADCARWLALVGTQSDVVALGATLHRETNGNPFFVRELVHVLGRNGDVAAVSDVCRVPQSVRDVVALRLARLGEDCRRTLVVAALLGDVIDGPLLARILDDPRHADHLQHALQDRLLVPGDAPGQYAFAHALIRRVLLDDTAASVRAAWHARIADVVERHATASPALTTDLVRHLAAAGTPDALRKAFDYACRGAEQAARAFGWEEAVRLWRVALEVGARADALDPARALELELALARALRAAGDVPAARACCEKVMAACRRTPNPTAFARAALIHAGPYAEWGRLEPEVRAVLEEAARAGAALDDALRARLYGRLAGDIVAVNERAQGARVYALCDEAADAARRAGDDGALAIALTGIYYAAAMGMRREGGDAPLPSIDEILAAAEAGGEHAFAVAIRHARAMTLLALGAPEEFSAEVDAVATFAAATRAPEAAWLAEALAGLRATLQGRFAEAHERIEHALAIGRRMQLPNAVPTHVGQRIMWHAFQGRLAETASEIEAFVSDHPGGAAWRPFRALARLARGDAVAARADLEELLAAGFPPAQRGVMARCLLAGFAALCVALRDREHGEQVYALLARRTDVWSMDGMQTFGPWALLQAGLARLCGRSDDAVEHLETAIQQGRRMGSPPIVARAQSMLASVLVATASSTADRTRIDTLLADAERTARALGLADVAGRVERVRARLASAPETPDVNAFRCDGEVWSVRFAGRDVRLKDGKGPRYLATLLSSPRRELHVLEFLGTSAAPSRPVEDGLSVGAPGAALESGPDQRARSEYRARVAELQAELAEAEERADLGRAERLRAELDELVDELASSFAGRPSRTGPTETARKAVTKVLRTQIGKLLELHPALGRHLRDTVRMGTVCVYAPADDVAWDVGFGPS